MLIPNANAAVFQHRPLRRLFRKELVLLLGVGALPLLSELDLRSLLAHELAHYGHGDTALHRYFARAESALAGIIAVLLEAVGVHGSRRRYIVRGDTGGMMTAPIAVVVWILTLPIRVLLVLYYLLRLSESRAAEFDADRTAIQAYGTQVFADAETGILIAARTMRGSASSLRAEMLKRNSQNFYAEMRRHYSELPPQIIVKLRLDALKEFRSLERTHPTTPDRLRAALIANAPAPHGDWSRPAIEALVPAGAQNADEVERQVTAILFAPKKAVRRGR